MKVRFQLWGQLRKATGISAPEVELSFGSVAADAIKVLADDFPDLQSILLDDGGEVRPVILVFRDSQQLEPHDSEPLSEGSELTLMSPIAGG